MKISLSTTWRSWKRRVLLRSLVWLQGSLEKPWFRRFVVRPFTWMIIYWTLLAFFFGWSKNIAESNNPEIKQLVEKYYNERTGGGLTDWDRTLGQSITWGPSGACIILLAAVVTAHISNPATFSNSPSLFIATACFAFSVPLYLVFGFSYLSQSDPKKEPPILKDFVVLHLLIMMMHTLFCLGFAAFLWSYDFKISIIFLIGCILAKRYFNRFTINANATQSKNNLT